jgi:hypothetical protein
VAIALICSRLLFIDMAMSKRAGLPNISYIQLLLIRTLERNPSFEMRSILIAVLRDVFQVAKRDDRIIMIFEMNMFTPLLGSVGRFSLSDRELLAKIVEVSLEDGSFSTTLRKYLSLLLDPSPSVALFITGHVSSLLALGRLNRHLLRENGFVPTLSGFFQARSKYFNLTDRLEIMTSLSLLNEGPAA